MYALRISRAAARLAQPSSTRNFTVVARKMADGDAGSPRSGGAASGDSFTKREQASENMYVRDQERQKLEAMKKKIADNEAQLKLDKEELENLGKK